LAYRHDEITDAGARIVCISVDSPGQHAATVEKLRLPFPLLSDPDRSRAITPWDLADPKDRRNIAIPAVIGVAPDGTEAFRYTARDFADRPTEDWVVDSLRGLGLPPTSQDPPLLGPVEPGPHAMPVEHLFPYFRGARFAAVAMSRRHPEIVDDATVYIAEMDRYMESAKRLFRES
jgi:hypothetical protein